MFFSQPEKSQMKPILYPEIFLRSKEGDLWHNPQVLDGEHAWLVKYFPKYFKNLILKGGERIGRAVRSKVERLKVVRNCEGFYEWDDPQNYFKKLLRSSRKTLSTIPSVILFDRNDQDFSSCLFFPKVNALDFTRHWRHEYLVRREDLHLLRPKLKEISRSYGYFWRGNRSLGSLEVALFDDFYFILLEKIDHSKRFLSSLKKLKLSISASKSIISELMKRKNILEHITHFTIQNSKEEFNWELIQSLISCCSQLYYL